MSGEVRSVDLLLDHIMQFAKVVELYQKEPQLLWVWQPRSPGERLPKGSGENCKEDRFKLERGDGKEGRLVLPEVGGYPTIHQRNAP